MRFPFQVPDWQIFISIGENSTREISLICYNLRPLLSHYSSCALCQLSHLVATRRIGHEGAQAQWKDSSETRWGTISLFAQSIPSIYWLFNNSLLCKSIRLRVLRQHPCTESIIQMVPHVFSFAPMACWAFSTRASWTRIKWVIRSDVRSLSAIHPSKVLVDSHLWFDTKTFCYLISLACVGGWRLFTRQCGLTRSMRRGLLELIHDL